jgi:DNA-binding CsgD family transcriptional regulator
VPQREWRLRLLLEEVELYSGNWTEIVELAASITDASSAGLFSLSSGAGPPVPHASYNLDFKLLATSIAEASQLSPIVMRALMQGRAPGWYCDNDVWPFDDFCSTTYFEKVWKPMRWRDGIHFICVAGSPQQIATLSLRRSPSQGPFGGDAKTWAERMQLDFTAAIARYLHGRTAIAPEVSGMRPLADLSVGHLQIEADGRISAMNSVARSIVEAKVGITIDGSGGLLISDTGAAAALTSFLHACEAGPPPPPLEFVLRQGEHRPVLAIASASPRSNDPAKSRIELLLVESFHRVNEERVARRAKLLFDLTDAESNILAALVAGRDSTTIAETRRSSPATVRTQIKQIMRKVGASSKSELMHLARLSDLDG